MTVLVAAACGFVLGWMAHVWKAWGDETAAMMDE